VFNGFSAARVASSLERAIQRRTGQKVTIAVTP
jgi:hypothetical protein